MCAGSAGFRRRQGIRVKRGVSMSTTWEEPAARRPLGSAAARIGALALLAVVGAVGGAAFASWAVGGNGAEAETETAMMIRDSALQDTVSPDYTAALPAAAPRQVGTERPDSVSASTPAVAPGKPGDLFAPSEFVKPDEQAAAEPVPDNVQEVTALPAARDVAALVVDGEPANPVEIAETEADVAALEERMAAETPVAEPEAEPNQQVAALDPSPEGAATSGPRGEAVSPATAAKYVNLRAGPDNDASVIAVVPAGAPILAQDGCRFWCAVVHDGKAGYIYNTFISR